MEIEMWKKCMPLWREAHFEVQTVKIRQVRTIFGSSDVGKSVRRCGAKQISKLKSTKHLGFESLFDDSMSKKYMPVWREAHLEVGCVKN